MTKKERRNDVNMTYGEKFKEVFGYYPCDMPCPEKCPNGRNTLNCHEGFGCEYFWDFREKEYEEKKEGEE